MTCPKCNSNHIATERRPDGSHICGNCHYSWKNEKDRSVFPSVEQAFLNFKSALISNYGEKVDFKIQMDRETRFQIMMDLWRHNPYMAKDSSFKQKTSEFKLMGIDVTEHITTTKQAVDHLCSELRKDPGYCYSWQSNIAMAFQDACADAGIKFPQLHDVSNKAAVNFLKNLMNEAAR